MKVTISNRAYTHKVVSVKTNVSKIVIVLDKVVLHYDNNTTEAIDSDKCCVEVE